MEIDKMTNYTWFPALQKGFCDIFFRIPDPTRTKRRGGKIVVLPFTEKIILFLKMCKTLSQMTKHLSIFYPKIVTNLSGSGMRKKFIPDPKVKKSPDPGFSKLTLSIFHAKIQLWDFKKSDHAPAWIRTGRTPWIRIRICIEIKCWIHTDP
jgi:hypothetical protein